MSLCVIHAYNIRNCVDINTMFSGVEFGKGVRARQRACLCIGTRFALLANLGIGTYVPVLVVPRAWHGVNGRCALGLGLEFCCCVRVT